MDLSSEETTVVATFANRHNAEVAGSLLKERGISAFVTADEVHPPLQLTEGVKLRVLTREAGEALEALHAAGVLETTLTERTDSGEGYGREQIGALEAEDDDTPRRATWVYVGLIALAVALLLGILVSATS